MAVRPDGKQFVTAGRDGRVAIWETATGKAVTPLNTHRDAIDAVAVSPDGQLAATVAFDESIRVWELATGKPKCLIAAPLNRESHERFWFMKHRSAFTPSGSELLFTAAGVLAMADSATGKPLELPGKLRGYRGNVSGFTADGNTLATTADNVITLWDWPTGKVRLAIIMPLVHEKADEPKNYAEVVTIQSAKLSPDGRILFAHSLRWSKDPEKGAFTNACTFWDARTGKLLHSQEMCRTVAFAPDGKSMFLGGQVVANPGKGLLLTDALTARNTVSGTLIRRFADPEAGRPPRERLRDSVRSVKVVAVSPDGRLLAVSEGAFAAPNLEVCLYETVSGELVKKLAGHSRWATDLAFSPDGRRLVSVSEDQTGLVWDVTLSAMADLPKGKPTETRLTEAWNQLAKLDSEPAYAGMATLAAAPAETIAIMKAKLRGCTVPTDVDLDRVVGQLDAEVLADRDKASAELEQFGPNAVSGSKARLAKTQSTEVRIRLTRFLKRFDGSNPSPYHLRCVRGVAILEAIGTPEAKAVLIELAKGPTEDLLTREAQTVIRRVRNP